MILPKQNPIVSLAEANASALFLSQEEMQKMARRRHQNLKLQQHRKWWTIVIWKDCFQDGKPKRRQVRVRIAEVGTNWRKVQKLRDDYLRPLNASLSAVGSVANFKTFVENT